MTTTKRTYAEIAFDDLMNDLRRILYLNTIASYTLESLRLNPYLIESKRTGTDDLKRAISRQISAMEIIRTELKLFGNSDSWHVLEQDYTSERIEDIGLLLDFISGVKNVAEVTKVLQEIFNEQIKTTHNA
jgi:hypothetical protein